MPVQGFAPQNMGYEFQVLGPTVAAAVGDFANGSEFDKVFVVISGLTAETISVTGMINSDFGSPQFTAALRPFDLNTGAVAAGSTLGNGSFVFVNVPGRLRFTKSAGTESVTIRIMGKAPVPR